MRVFTCNNFAGHWPTCTAAAVVVAESFEQARALLLQELEAQGLKQSDDWEPEMALLDLNGPACCIILADGDY